MAISIGPFKTHSNAHSYGHNMFEMKVRWIRESCDEDADRLG